MLGGKPGLHSLYFLFILAVNAVGNIILTPILGALGTAIATGLSYAVAALLLIYLAWRQLNVRLW
jgi:O-antigen/teichoic acid export membrane protein